MPSSAELSAPTAAAHLQHHHQMALVSAQHAQPMDGSSSAATVNNYQSALHHHHQTGAASTSAALTGRHIANLNNNHLNVSLKLWLYFGQINFSLSYFFVNHF